MEITNRKLIDYICNSIDCSQKLIASLIGVSESTLSDNAKKSVVETLSKKTGKRLLHLFVVVASLVEEGLSPKAIYNILIMPSYRDLEGVPRSISILITEGKESLNFIIEVVKKSKETYLAKLKRNQELKVQVLDLMRA